MLRASVILLDSHQQASPDQRCHLPRLPRSVIVVLQRLAEFLDVEILARVLDQFQFPRYLYTRKSFTDSKMKGRRSYVWDKALICRRLGESKPDSTTLWYLQIGPEVEKIR